MMNFNTNEFKNGLKILVDNIPMTIIENKFINPGKGQAFNRVKLRNLKNGRTIERTFKSGMSIKVAKVLELMANYSYYDGEFFVFIENKTFEQYRVPKKLLVGSVKWMKKQAKCTIVLHDDNPINIILPKFVQLKVISTNPGIKGNTAKTTSKLVTLETGATIKVPLFIQNGEVIMINTVTGEYVSRAKN